MLPSHPEHRAFHQGSDRCNATFRQGGQLVPSQVQVPQSIQLPHLHRQPLELITAHILQKEKGEGEDEEDEE